MKTLVKKTSCVFLAVLLCLSVFGCGKDPGKDVDIAYSFEDDHLIGLCEMLLPNVVELRYGAGFATGFVYTLYDGDAVIVTNCHLSGGEEFAAGHVDARFSGRTSFQSGLTMLGYDSRYDTVFLRSEYYPEKAIDLRANTSTDNRMGQRVLAIGNGMGTGLAAAEGIIAQPDKIVTVSGNTVPAIQISVPVNAGNSGSPLFNMKGELIGLNFAQTTSLADDPERFVDGVSYSMPIAIVNALFEAAVNNPGGAIPMTDTVLLTELAAAKEFTATLKYLGVYTRMSDDGLTVTGLSATAVAPFVSGDVIESVGDVPVSHYRGLVSAMLGYGKNGKGAGLTFGVRRGKESVQVEGAGFKRYTI